MRDELRPLARIHPRWEPLFIEWAFRDTDVAWCDVLHRPRNLFRHRALGVDDALLDITKLDEPADAALPSDAQLPMTGPCWVHRPCWCCSSTSAIIRWRTR
jgi:hypothetical protein